MAAVRNVTAKSRANLLKGHPRLKKGVTNNPGGRVKNPLNITVELRKQLDRVCPSDPQKRRWVEVIVERALVLAAQGKAGAMQEIWNRCDGKVKEEIELGGKGGGPVTIKVVYDEPK